MNFASANEFHGKSGPGAEAVRGCRAGYEAQTAATNESRMAPDLVQSRLLVLPGAVLHICYSPSQIT